MVYMKSKQAGLNLRIAFRLLIGVLIGLGVAGLRQMSDMNARVQGVTESLWPKVELARSAVQYSDLNNRIMMEVFLLDDKEEIAKLLEQRAANTQKISAIFNQIEAGVTQGDERRLLDRVAVVRRSYIDSYLTAIDLLTRQDKPQEARDMMVRVILPKLNAYHEAWENFVAYQGRQMNLATADVADQYAVARWSTIAAILAAVLLAGGVSASVMRRVTAEISNRQRAEQELQTAHAGLELRVRERTAELQVVQQELVDASRLAGMAEVATEVLHNVGNVLNRVTVSGHVIAEKIRQSPVANLCKAAEMIQAHRGDLASFLTTDAKGRCIPDYLVGVAGTLHEDNAAMVAELSNLECGIEHIKQIVAFQTNQAKSCTVRLPVDPREVIDEAIRIAMPMQDSGAVAIVRELADIGMVEIDKHKAMQILVNLITNARNAVQEAVGNSAPTVTVRLRKVDRQGASMLQCDVIDNGVGIAGENLTRVFNHGFTTRAAGHGFGLHSAANAAQQMGGRLTVHSDGPGRGARFTLELPISSAKAMAA